MGTFKKKMWLTIIATTLVFALAIGTLVAVLASNNIIVNSNVSVQYDSTINANVSANYWMDNASLKTNFIADQPISVDTAGSPSNIALNETDRYVIFEYVFTNNMVNMDAYGKLTYADDLDNDDTNIIVGYYISDTEVSIADIEDKTFDESHVEGVCLGNVKLTKNAKTYVYIKARIDKLENDGEFSGTYHWDFSYDMYEFATDQAFFEFEGNTLTKYLGGAGDTVIVPSSYTPASATVSHMSASDVDGTQVAVKAIGSSAFENQTMLSKVVLPETIISLGESAFKGCTTLTDVNLPNSIELMGISLFENSQVAITTLPSSITEIPDKAFCGNTTISSLEIPASVKIIDEHAFDGCANLQSITFAQGSQLELIEDYAFYNCKSLTNIELPDGLLIISVGSFDECNELGEIEIPASVKNIGSAFNYTGDGYHTYGLTIRYLGTIDDWCEVELDALCLAYSTLYIDGVISSEITEITISAGVTKISGSNFYNFSNLKTVNFADGIELESIGDYAFYLCTSLEHINIPSSVNSIGERAFYSCTSLASVNIPASVNSIRDYAFFGCSLLTTINFEDESQLKNIGDKSFDYCDALSFNEYDNALYLGSSQNPYLVLVQSKNKEITSCQIPSTTKVIADYAFSDCKKLETLNFANESQINAIGRFAFNSCEKLSSIQIPSSVTRVGKGAFSYCNALEIVTFAEGSQIQTIDDGVFSNCEVLTKVEYPRTINDWYKVNNLDYYYLNSKLYIDGVKATEITEVTISVDVIEIKEGAFYGFTKLQTITFAQGSLIEKIGANAFSNCEALENIELPANVTSIGGFAFSGCKSLTNIKIPSTVTDIESYAFFECEALEYNEYDNALYLGNSQTPYLYLIQSKNKEITSCQIHSSTKIIASEAFSSCTLLETITFDVGSQVEKLGNNAFYYCLSLKSIELPDSVTSIGDWVFADCEMLARVELSENVTSIGNYTFYNCASLNRIALPQGEWAWTTIENATTGTTLTENQRNPETLAYNIRVFSWYERYLIRTDI